jgi:uncharacterized protein YbaR (Trm112 family)
MRDTLADLLNCSVCRSSDLELTARVRDAREIREGELTCWACQSHLPIRQGIVHALPTLPPKIAAEIQG